MTNIALIVLIAHIAQSQVPIQAHIAHFCTQYWNDSVCRCPGSSEPAGAAAAATAALPGLRLGASGRHKIRVTARFQSYVNLIPKEKKRIGVV